MGSFDDGMIIERKERWRILWNVLFDSLCSIPI